MKKAILIIGIIILVISVMVSCVSPMTTSQTSASLTAGESSSLAQQTSSVTAIPTPKYGGVLKIVVVNPSNYFGYPGDMGASSSVEVSMPCIEKLVRLDARGLFDPSGLITAYEVNQDLTSVTFTLRKDVKFHDGTDFNAQAVKWVLDESKKIRLAGTELFNSTEVVDEYHIKVNVKHFDIRVFQAVADAKVSSPTAFGKYGKDGIHRMPVGTGPFKFVSFTPDIGITWERFDGYWGGKPYLDGIKTIFIADDMARASALQSGDVDVLFNVTPETAIGLRTKGFITAPGNIPNFWSLIPDSVNTNSPLSKALVRQAIEYSIDRKALAQLGNDFWIEANQPSEPNSPGYISNFEGRQYNVSKARDLLAQAGYADGFEVAIIYNQAYLLRDPLVAVQEMLSKVGIKADIQGVTADVRTAFSRNGWQNGFIVQQVYLGPTQYISGFNYCLGPDGPSSISCTRPPGWKEALNEAFYASPADLDAACRKLNTLLYEDATLTPLYIAPQVIYAMADYVHDAHIYESGNIWAWTPEKTWLSK